MSLYNYCTLLASRLQLWCALGNLELSARWNVQHNSLWLRALALLRLRLRRVCEATATSRSTAARVRERCVCFGLARRCRRRPPVGLLPPYQSRTEF